MKKNRSLFLKGAALLFAATLVFAGCKTDVPEDNPGENTEQTGGETTGGETGGEQTSTVKKYKVTFDSDGGSEVKALTVEEGSKATKPETDPTKEGYTFGSWMNGEAAYDFETAVSADLTLKATWTATAYTINYDVGEGTNAETNPATYTIESEDISLANPTGPEATPNFVAWHTSAKPAEGEWGDKVVGVAIAKGSTGNKAFYAEFSAKAVYTVTYYDGETALKTETVVEGGKATAPAADKEGYVFDAWYSDAALTTKADLTAVTGNISVYAGFKIVTYTVSFTSADGTEIPAQTINHGANAVAPTTALGTRTGFTANGKWYLDGKEFDFATETIKADTKLIAGWKYDTPVVIETSETTPTVLSSDGTPTVITSDLGDDYLAKAGDIITIKLSALSNIAIEDLSVDIVCNAADTVFGTQTSYGYIVLAKPAVMKAAVTAKEDFDASIDVLVIADANGTGKDTHKIRLSMKEADEPAKLYKAGTNLDNAYVSQNYTYTIDSKTIAFTKNGTYNYQTSITDVIPADVVLKATDTVTITIKGCYDVDVPNLAIQIIDNASDTILVKDGWAYHPISGYITVAGNAVAEHTDFEYTKEITITEDQIGTGANAHKVNLMVGFVKDTEDNITNECPTIYPQGHDFASTKTVIADTVDLTDKEAYAGTKVINVSDYVPANKTLSDYAFVKLNVTFKDADDNEVLYEQNADGTTKVATGQVVLLGEDGWTTPIVCISNINGTSSEYSSIYCPLSVYSSGEVKSLVKIAVQNTGTNCASMTVNYIDYILAPEAGIAAYYVSGADAIAAIKAETSKTLVIGYTMTAEGKAGWGIGGLVTSSWGGIAANLIESPNPYSPDTLIYASFAGTVVDDTAAYISLYNSALYQFAYIK